MTLGVSPGELLERAAALRHQGQPFVLATVVRSVKPASARPGDRALILDNQSPVGWVGGGCVHTAVTHEAAAALASGAPRLVRLSPEPREEDGVINYPMTCHSGGTLEIYLEPVLPAPILVILGESPVASALAALAEPLGFRVSTSLGESAAGDVWVVAAAMSSDEDHPLVREALLAGAGYVAMVASRRRAEVLIASLRADGVSNDVIGRLKAPAGLDIGAANAAEIALSILAEIVQLRRHQPLAVNAALPGQTATDPICGMEVDIATARWTADKDGEVFYFCAPGCRRAFVAS